MWAFESSFWDRGYTKVAGFDEAGRGAWAGPLVVAAVILPSDGLSRDYRDSKQLSAIQRMEYAQAIQREAVAWGVAFASHEEIDAVNVLRATRNAALRLVEQIQPDAAVTDYLRLDTDLPQVFPAKADQKSYSVAAASILAKVARDAHCLELDALYPQYGFAQHKGYGTLQHRRALEQHGPSPIHRMTFSPLKKLKNSILETEF